MRKLSVTLALVLCLVLCVFALASCGGGSDATDKPETTPDATTPDATADTATAATECAHVPAEEETVEDATCTEDGSRYYLCTICEQPIPDTVTVIPATGHTEAPEEEWTTDAATCISTGTVHVVCEVCGRDVRTITLDIDPDAHDIDEWIETPISLLNPNGTKTGHCSLCNQDIPEDTKYQPKVWNSNDKSSGNVQDRMKYVTLRGENHFYPDETNDGLGNDLIIEFSLLYTEEMLQENPNGLYISLAIGDDYEIVTLKLGENASANTGTVVGGFSARQRSNATTSTWIYPTAETIEADPAAKYPTIGEFGWHRIALRLSQTAAINLEGKVEYTLIGKLYLDGAKILEFDASGLANSDKTIPLFTATKEVDENGDETGNLVYADNDSSKAWSAINLENFYTATDMYLVIADMYMTCSREFVQNVTAVADPAPASYTIDDMGTEDTADDVICTAAAIYYQLAE